MIAVSILDTSVLVSSDMANLNQRDMAKQLLTPFATHCTYEFFIENYGSELFNQIGTVGKAELFLTFATALCECWNVNHKYICDNAAELKQLSMDQTQSADNRSN